MVELAWAISVLFYCAILSDSNAWAVSSLLISVIYSATYALHDQLDSVPGSAWS